MAEFPKEVRRVFRVASRRPPIDEDVDAEVAFHLEMRTAEFVSRGFTPEAAMREARRLFGDTHQWSAAMSEVDRERNAQERRTEWLDDLKLDVRFGLRSLLRTPTFTLLAVLTLALGVGANAAVFGIVKSVLLDSLPYASAEHLVRVHTRFLDGSAERAPISAAMIADIAERQRSFEQLAAFNHPSDAVVTGVSDPYVGRLLWVESGFFPMLGVAAARGRTFTPEDLGDTARVVVLDHRAWQRYYGGDQELLGRSIRINGIDREVIGVLPRHYVSPSGAVDFYFPLDLGRQLLNPVNARRLHWYDLIGRLRPGVTVEAAERELAAIGVELAREHPQFHGATGVSGVPLRETLVGDTRTPLLVLMASAGLVLLITCANLAGALLSRTLSRRKEFAVRSALGAGRGRIVRQLLTESAVLAIAGGTAGLLLAKAALAAAAGLATAALPEHAELRLDGGAVLVTGLMALLTGIAFGVAPAIAAARSHVQGTMRDEDRGTSESRRTRQLRGVLVAGQIALCVSLLAGAGLLTRSLLSLSAVPTGFAADGVLAVPVQLPRGGYGNPGARVNFVTGFEERLRVLPGVSAVATAGQVPMKQTGGIAPVSDDAADGASGGVMLLKEVTDDYFRALGIPLRAGRTFGPEDHADATNVVIVSERAARQLAEGREIIGARIRLVPDADSPRVTVVGVVGDTRNDPALPEAQPTVYMPYRQAPWNGPVFLLRTSGDPMALLAPFRAALASADPTIPIHHPTTVDAVLSEGMAGRRLPVVLMTAFGALALLLASVGVYAMFAAMAAAREREFGIRIALGSTPVEIAALVLRQGGIWMVAGLVLGIGGVVVVARLISGLLYGVPPLDPVSLGGAVGVLMACAAVALLGPVRRATRVDPISTLR